MLAGPVGGYDFECVLGRATGRAREIFKHSEAVDLFFMESYGRNNGLVPAGGPTAKRRRVGENERERRRHV